MQKGSIRIKAECYDEKQKVINGQIQLMEMYVQYT